VASCGLWWDTTLDILKTWEESNREWDVFAAFIQGATDPALAATIAVDSFWFNPTTSILGKWDGSSKWVTVVDFIDKELDPAQSANYAAGSAWYKPSTNTWMYWTGTLWSAINPIDSLIDPTLIATGTYWFNTSNLSLQVRSGVTWLNQLFTTQPYAKARGEQWYNTTTNELYEWSGTTWILAVPVVDVAFTTAGHFLFWTREQGSNTAVLIPTPEGSTAHSTPCSIGTGYAYDGVSDIASAECEYANDGNVVRVYPARNISNSSFLWSNIPSSVVTPKGGNDGISGVP